MVYFDASVGYTLDLYSANLIGQFVFPTSGSVVNFYGGKVGFFNNDGLVYNNRVNLYGVYCDSGLPQSVNMGSGLLRLHEFSCPATDSTTRTLTIADTGAPNIEATLGSPNANVLI